MLLERIENNLKIIEKNINKENLNCKTCFDRNIPNDFLNYTFQLLTKYDLAKSL